MIHRKNVTPTSRIGIGAAILALILVALSACALKPGVTTTPPTPFPTLPLTPTPTATPYVFVPSSAPTTAAPPEPVAAEAIAGPIPLDGELVTLIPPIAVSVPQGVGGELIALHAQLGHWVRQGDLIASVDDGALQRALAAAQQAAEQAKAARAADEQRAEETYQRARQLAQWNLDRAWHAVQVAEKRPPTVAIARAEAALAGAINAESVAADAYKQSLDRGWEPAEIRDGLYRAWQTTITNRKLAELDLQDAQLALSVHEMELTGLRQEVSRARTTLDSLEREVNPGLAWAESAALQALAEAHERQALAELYAPCDGLVIALGAAVGATVNDSTPIVTLLDASELRFVTTDLEEAAAARLRPGQPARIVLRFYPDTLLLGEVEMLLPLAAQRAGAGQGSPHFEAYFRLTDTAGLALLPGMTGRAEVSVETE